jgi:hypothetical protein
MAYIDELQHKQTSAATSLPPSRVQRPLASTFCSTAVPMQSDFAVESKAKVSNTP